MNEHAPDFPRPHDATTLHGARAAVGLAGALLVAMALVTAVPWLGNRATPAEQIVQIPVPLVTPKPPPAILAPDPGDTP